MNVSVGGIRAAGRAVVVALSRPRRGEVAVSYGHRRLPKPGELVEGGMVKFQRLQTVFPNRPRDFNVLYLGSSSLPSDLETLLRLTRRRQAAVVLNQNGVAYPAWAGDRTEAINASLRRVLRASSHVFYQSDFCKLAADRYLGEASCPWEVLHNAVDTTVFTPADRTAGDGPVLLSAGDQYHAQRLAVTLRTFALVAGRHPGARLLVTGRLREDGPELERRLGLEGRVDYVGRYTQRDAPSVYQRADLLLHVNVNDACPNVVLEAMSSGLPVVYSASGGTPELVGDEAGIGVAADPDWERATPPEPESLAEAVERLLSQLSAYRAAARARAVERFDLRPWIERHVSVFEGLLS